MRPEHWLCYQNLLATAKKGSCSAPQAVSRYQHATLFATTCIPRF